MEKVWKRWLESDKLKKVFRKDNLLVLLLTGILLFIIALPTKKGGGGEAAGQGSAADGREAAAEAEGPVEAAHKPFFGGCRRH